MAHTVSDVMVERLIEWGVDTAFGLPGDGINGFYEALRTHQDQIRLIHVRHEEVAAMAASAYGKFTARPALCVATAGPGAVHLPNGLYDARIDQSPVVAVTAMTYHGMTYHDVIGTHFLQDINHDHFMHDPCWYSQSVMGEAHVLHVTDMAARMAIAHRERIALTMSRAMAREMTYSTSPTGVVERAKEKLEDVVGRGDGAKEE